MKTPSVYKFRSIFLITFFLLFAALPVDAQTNNYFIAGEHTGVYYYDIEPNYIIDNFPPPYEVVYEIDLDFDGIDDFAIKGYQFPGLSFFQKYIKIQTHNSSEVAFGYNQTCYNYLGDSTASCIFSREG